MTDAAPEARDEFSEPSPSDRVYFSVVGRPKAGYEYDEFRERLSLENLESCLPTPEVRAALVIALQKLGFDVDEGDGAVITASGPASLFTDKFKVPLVRRQRTVALTSGSWTSVAVVPREGGERISTAPLLDALFIAVEEPPLPLAPRLPPPVGKGAVVLRVPGDIAQLTRASAAHRLALPSGELATGRGVGVAVLDFGFAQHPFYCDHGYRIHRWAAHGASNPEIDLGSRGHGTWVLAGLLACAPDAEVHAFKVAANLAGAVQMATRQPGVRVLSLSLSTEDHRRNTPLTRREFALRAAILKTVSRGITVIASAGSADEHAFPAMMPEVCAVGGIEIDDRDELHLLPGSSHFVNPIYPKRRVPDLCAVGADLALPVPNSGWDTFAGATSAAAPQVAAAAALLLQKKPSLTPMEVRRLLMAGASPVRDAGTGAGLVDALASWRLA